MKKHFLLGCLLYGLASLSCSKEESESFTVLKSDPPKSAVMELSGRPILIAGATTDWVEIEESDSYKLHIYSGRIVLRSGISIEFSAKEQLSLDGKFMFGMSWYTINGIQYESNDVVGPSGKGVTSFLSLRLPDGQSRSGLGKINRTAVLIGPPIKSNSEEVDKLPAAEVNARRKAKISLSGYFFKT